MAADAPIGVARCGLAVEAEQRAVASPRRVELRRLVPVVEGQHVAPAQRRCDARDPARRFEIDFGVAAVAGEQVQIVEVARERLVGERAGPIDEARSIVRDVDLAQLAAVADDAVHRERIEQFVREHAAFDAWGKLVAPCCRFIGCVSPRRVFGDLAERAALFVAQERARFDEGVPQRSGEAGLAVARPLDDVPCEEASSAALFDDVEARRTGHNAPQLMDLARDERTEDGMHLGTGDIITATARRFGPGAVVAVLRVVQRGVHEVAERHRTFAVDAAAKLPHEGSALGDGLEVVAVGGRH